MRSIASSRRYIFTLSLLAVALALGCMTPTPSSKQEEAVKANPVCIGDLEGEECDGDSTKCCVCQYSEDPDCAGGTGPCEDRGRDCREVNGTCQDRHIEECQDWLDEQTGCDDVILAPRGEDPDLDHCDTVVYDYDGHGCANIDDEDTDIITACIDAGVCNFDGIFEGCSTFDDMDAVMAWLEGLQGQLGDGQVLRIRGNQCTSSDACQVGQCTIDVTCDDIDVQLPPCGSECLSHSEGETALCGDIKDPTTQVCCCSGGDCQFQDGETCGGGTGGDPTGDVCSGIQDRATCLSTFPPNSRDSCGWTEPSGPCSMP